MKKNLKTETLKSTPAQAPIVEKEKTTGIAFSVGAFVYQFIKACAKYDTVKQYVRQMQTMLHFKNIVLFIVKLYCHSHFQSCIFQRQIVLSSGCNEQYSCTGTSA